MPQLIKPGDVKIITKDGEVKISISLDLNINMGEVSGGVGILKSNIEQKINKKEEDKVQWAIPDFAPTEKINFGKGG
jgi:hypothetical protein